jgi:hypothetical protein
LQDAKKIVRGIEGGSKKTNYIVCSSNPIILNAHIDLWQNREMPAQIEKEKFGRVLQRQNPQAAKRGKVARIRNK